MFLCAPVAFAFAVVGFYRVVRSRRFNVLFWLFAVMIFYYLLTFVIYSVSLSLGAVHDDTDNPLHLFFRRRRGLCA